jgi:hypothetical protein
MRTFILTAMLGLLITLPGASGAQVADSSAKRQALFETLRDSQWVRLASPGLGRRDGRLLDRTGSELVLWTESESLRVPASSIDTVWTRGRSTVVGAIVGGLIGAGLGIIAGSTFGEENAGSAKNVVGLAGIGMAGLGLIGAAIGTAVPRWQRRYP